MTPSMILVLLLAVSGSALVAMALRVRSTDPVRALAAEFDADMRRETLDGYHATLETPLLTRLFGPLAATLERTALRLLPSNALDAVRSRLTAAGLITQVTAEEYMAFRLLAALGGVTFGVVLGFATGGARGVAAGVFALGVGLAAPRAFVDRARAERVESIERELPDSLDLLAISVEAGLGFEQALAVVCDRSDTVLAQEFGHTLKEMQLGRSRVEALHELQRRVDVPDVNQLVLALVQADALGMPMTRILKSQAAELRRRRRQRVREEAAKLPVKMLFPLVLFILPALFVVVLGPALISLARTL